MSLARNCKTLGIFTLVILFLWLTGNTQAFATNGGGKGSKPVYVTGISLAPETISMNANDKDVELVESIKPVHATNKKVTWSTSNPQVATVTNSGVVHPEGPGTTTVTVTTMDGNFKAKTKVMVSDRIVVKSVAVKPKLVNLTVSEEAQLTAKVLPVNATDQELAWFSFNPRVASVSDGVIQAKSPGITIIKVFTNNGHFDWSLVTVCPSMLVPVKSLSLNPKNITLTVGGKDETLTADVTPDNATSKILIWSTSDSSVATVNNGIVHPVGPGVATITVATVDGKIEDTAKVTVTAPVTGVKISPESLNLTVGGEDKTLNAEVSPANATNKKVLWSSSDSSIATVDEGIVRPVGPGQAVITATTEDGRFTASTHIKVTVPVTGITLDSAELNLTVGGKEPSLTETISPANATNKNVTWTTYDASVALIENGTVHPIGPGQTIITVTTEDGHFSASATINVTVPVTGVLVSPDTLELIVGGEDKTLTESISPVNATNKKVTWTSSDTGVATVDNGVVHPVGSGTAIITASTEDGGFTDETTVKVTSPVTDVSLDPKTLSFNLGDADQTLKATLLPSNATNQHLSWTTSDPKVATVVNGVVHAVGVGQAIITVTTEDGSLSDTATITVVDPDTIPPVTKNKMTPIFNDKNAYIIALTVTYIASDDKTGVKETLYRINGGTWQLYTKPFDVSADKTHTLEYYSTDKAGNKEKINFYDFDKGTCSCSK
ncbi:Ig-like domain-containing protein [Peribacillus muralis]|uniref:Ig-like domain-containing protein n=1 Tax=Peribacillus muralis TaxID=264697 RepID=UPI0007096EFC|nr:Ig-like domain-containing protein [Peribacillus muralis]